ncbi:PAS domain-containing hybrid sensor histidine kinase/response regulator [Ideonella sp. BN130291]|uniref:PAS domain-containing hybrid sensor histidine kinase/response regulator n=1 Tax=Ideonella sp. BN130291 TaxID=3112940 RepID=UPI002E276AC6|nr:ATP-binding protein [Ideonella sp. BN130291]
MSESSDTTGPPAGGDGTPQQLDRLLFEANPLPLWIYDLQTLRILDVNEVACQKYGYSREEFLALTIRDIRPPEDIPQMEASVRDTPEKSFNSGIWRHRLKDGALINVEITSHEMIYHGRRTRFVCPIDVTQRVRAEAALREREAGLRRAQALTALGHVITGPDGGFESWSETLPQLAGIQPADMPTSTREWLGRLVHPDDREAFRAKSVEAARTGTRVDVEYRLVQPGGRLVEIRQVIEPIEGSRDPAHVRWFSTLQDVTEQKQAQARVMRLNEELEQRVRERTTQLEVSNHELALATAAAERANRAKTEFLSNMSHELRTPLNAIIGFGQLLAAPKGPLGSPEQAVVFVNHIVRAGRHLLTLINDLLDLAQIESGKFKVAIDRLPLGEVLAECQAMIEPQSQQRGIRLLFPAEADVQVLADRTRLKQVLLNLLSNAVKYNRERGAVVVDHSTIAPGRVRITVQDTGGGPRAVQVEALFQPFNRLGQEAGSAEGTGIGLVVTKRMVELMDGQIGVNSTPGMGTLFWVDLPAEVPHPAPAAQRTTVLVVEDDAASLQLVQQVLAARPDLQVLCATDGRRGVELARQHQPALILMDNNMPHMSGREAHALLRQEPATASIPIIALSGNASATAVEQGRASGYVAYLTKPLDPAELQAAVNQVLRPE